MLISTNTTKLHELVEQVQFVVFEKFTRLLITQNDKGKYSVSLTNNVHEKTSKNITESQDRQNLKACKLNL